ncbi:helix-turn-helix domain-containing protein [Cellulophaga baltica]|uniref:helix-turn-helix domain-containing protein n=1 Tax=Cellulophaga baltica TaxID=76594 RepID=UPI0015F60D3D|nr:helix-turn-helix transcriptional regulator [Cellulophaga baltica]MBA6313868.1 hypothetical protein [Cellulophaga baltica]
MKSSENNIQNLDLAFDSLFNEKEVDYDIEAKVIASKLLSEIAEIADKNNMNRKTIAELIGTSASYLTQLYRGNKLLNFVTLAKLKDKLNLNIEIKISENNYDNSDSDFNYQNLRTTINNSDKRTNWSIFKNLKPDSEEVFTGGPKSSMKIIKQQLTA